ncbi:peptidyl-prolyl cis-trans isomerase, partial [Candidatus Fermentibacterales bacterium]|nr:peptidyl-prolyl cis-trans isomerase [Candidatus Fermentibacterales bacterium]
GAGEIPVELVLCRGDGGDVTAGEVRDLLERLRPESFMGGLPEELSLFGPPVPGALGPELDLWFYVQRLAQVRAQAEAGRSRGLDDGVEDIAQFALVEHMIRMEVLETAREVDSSYVLDYYGSNRELFFMPERRSILLAYVPADSLGRVGRPGDFSDLSGFTMLDESGEPLPTPLQVRQAFGPLADAVFSAEEGMLTGPLQDPGSGINVFFQVVDIEEEGYADPCEIWAGLSDVAVRYSISSGFESFLEELSADYGVEIDSSAVSQVDPWGGAY